MKAVILAAGEGKRMLPLTRTIPKPLLRIRNRTILDYIFDALPEEIDRVIVVVGYLKKKIQEHIGCRYRGKNIRYVVQEVLSGSATALMCAQDLFLPRERFLLIYGDELTSAEEVRACLSYEFSWACCPVENPSASGIAEVDQEGYIVRVVEKPEHPVSNLAAAGVMVMDSRIFSYQPVPHQNGEYYLSSLMNQFAKVHPVRAVTGKSRPPFISPDEIETLNQIPDNVGLL